MKIQRLLLPKQEKEILKICDDLNTYWKTNNNFEVAVVRYFQDLTFKYNLGLVQDEIFEIVNKILFKLFNDFNISYGNAMYIFAQFIIYYIFKDVTPRHVRVDFYEIFNIAKDIENYLIPPETRLGGFKVVLDSHLKRKVEEFWYLGGAHKELFAYCSDNECPCSQTKIPRNEGYIYVIDHGNGKVTANLTCEQGAKLRNLNLKIASNDAKRWWITGMVPFRTTPKQN